MVLSIDEFEKPVEVWCTDLFECGGRISFIPFQRLHSKFAAGFEYINDEKVMCVCPLNAKVFIWYYVSRFLYHTCNLIIIIIMLFLSTASATSNNSTVIIYFYGTEVEINTMDAANYTVSQKTTLCHCR